MLRRLLKDGQVNFCENTRAVDKGLATKLVEEARKEGYNAKVYANALGYTVKMLG